MFNIFKKKQPAGTKAVFKLAGLHCNSCAMSIDNALEEVAGVLESKTSYAKAETTVYFDASQTNQMALKKVIKQTGYQVVEN